MPYSATDLIRDVMALLTQRGLTPVIRVSDLRLAHEAARTLLCCMNVLPPLWIEDDPVFVRIEDDER